MQNIQVAFKGPGSAEWIKLSDSSTGYWRLKNEFNDISGVYQGWEFCDGSSICN
ncbi:hypothetical protein [Chitinophaga japonensis]|uniref:hypothetical protein n=1 Tax=Chitinophaga japonensis TaxID=104662 RepID=UPI0013158165|nr:hypothetical protein [Chitinophaga japonensis]